MIRNNHYFSVNRALWHHINFNAVYEIRAQQANENERNVAVAETDRKTERMHRVETMALLEE